MTVSIPSVPTLRLVAAMAISVATVFARATDGPTTRIMETRMESGIRVEKVADNLVFPEGPVWHPKGFLLFSDVHGKTMERLKPEGGTVTWFDRGKKTNGTIMSLDGKGIYTCCFSERELLWIDAETAEFRVLANAYKGKPLNNVNDVAIDAQGNVFFSDPKWGAKDGDLQGVYRLRPNGDFSLAVEVKDQPNGLVVSPDQKWLYVARSGAHNIMRYALHDGELTSGTEWIKLDPGDEPDGMTVDKAGNLYVAQAGNGKLRVLTPEGKTLHLIPIVNRMATNCEFEGGNEKVLYVTCGGRDGERTGTVYRVTFP